MRHNRKRRIVVHDASVRVLLTLVIATGIERTHELCTLGYYALLNEVIAYALVNVLRCVAIVCCLLSLLVELLNEFTVLFALNLHAPIVGLNVPRLARFLQLVIIPCEIDGRRSIICKRKTSAILAVNIEVGTTNHNKLVACRVNYSYVSLVKSLSGFDYAVTGNNVVVFINNDRTAETILCYGLFQQGATLLCMAVEVVRIVVKRVDVRCCSVTHTQNALGNCNEWGHGKCMNKIRTAKIKCRFL